MAENFQIILISFRETNYIQTLSISIECVENSNSFLLWLLECFPKKISRYDAMKTSEIIPFKIIRE